VAEDARALRELFYLDPSVVFLNHGSFGACPRPVLEACQAWQREMERQPVEFLARRSFELVGEARARLARFIGASPDDLVFVPNATTGVNIVAHSLVAGLGPGDEVLSTDHEYGACDRAWRLLCRRVGAAHVNARIRVPVADADEVIEAVWSRVGPRTRVLFVSHITSPTGLVMPVQELCRRARDAGITTLVDGAHAPGQLPLDVGSIGADFYVGNCHKWLCAPKGAGFLHAAVDVQARLDPLIVSWGVEPLPEWPRVSPLVDRLQWAGTDDIAPWLSVPAAIDFRSQHEWDDVVERCRELGREAREGLMALPGVESLHAGTGSAAGPAPGGGWTVQMEAVSVEGIAPQVLKERLYGVHRVEVPVSDWQGRTVLRASLQGYNTSADVDALVGAVKSSLPA